MGSLSGLAGWIEHNLLIIVILFVGLMILFKANSQNHKGAFTIAGIALLGLAVMGLAVGGNALNVGNWIVSLFTG